MRKAIANVSLKGTNGNGNPMLIRKRSLTHAGIIGFFSLLRNVKPTTSQRPLQASQAPFKSIIRRDVKLF